MCAKEWEYRYVIKSGWHLSGEESPEFSGMHRQQGKDEKCVS